LAIDGSCNGKKGRSQNAEKGKREKGKLIADEPELVVEDWEHLSNQYGNQSSVRMRHKIQVRHRTSARANADGGELSGVRE
jgi:hypothetical protein